LVETHATFDAQGILSYPDRFELAREWSPVGLEYDEEPDDESVERSAYNQSGKATRVGWCRKEHLHHTKKNLQG
jgi:hypothetical protein